MCSETFPVVNQDFPRRKPPLSSEETQSPQNRQSDKHFLNYEFFKELS